MAGNWVRANVARQYAAEREQAVVREIVARLVADIDGRCGACDYGISGYRSSYWARWTYDPLRYQAPEIDDTHPSWDEPAREAEPVERLLEDVEILDPDVVEKYRVAGYTIAKMANLLGVSRFMVGCAVAVLVEPMISPDREFVLLLWAADIFGDEAVRERRVGRLLNPRPAP